MTTKSTKLLAEALQLSERDRAEIAARLLDSLDSQRDENVREAWDAEITRRIGEVDQSEVTLMPWPEARRMILGRPHGPSDA